MVKKIKTFLILNTGLILVAVGISLFKAPNHFALGGVSGLSIIFSRLFPALDVGTFMFIINTILVIIGFIFLGRDFGISTIYSSFALSFYVWGIGKLIPMNAPFTNDTLLELAYAVVLPAVGSAIIFNIGSSTGGTDIVAMILSKYIKIEIGKALLVSDFFIAFAAGIVFGVKTGLYSVLGLIIKAFLVDTVIESFNIRKLITIISKHPEEIKDYIINTLKRSATIHMAYGAYSHEQWQVITTTLSRRQAVELRNYIRKLDADAFITITNSSETIGKGFRAI